MKPQGDWNPMSCCCWEAHDDQHHGATTQGGLDAQKYPRRLRAGKKCLLTSPFIGLPSGGYPAAIH
jgi:hypothetical protein